MAAATAWHALDLARVASIRIPAIGAGLVAATMVSEIAFRVASYISSPYLTGARVTAFLARPMIQTTVTVIRPYKDMSIKTLLISAVACAVLGSVATWGASVLFGPAPAIYNRVLSYLGPVRIDDAATPWLQWGLNRLGF